jgi:hypothetical protein
VTGIRLDATPVNLYFTRWDSLGTCKMRKWGMTAMMAGLLCCAVSAVAEPAAKAEPSRYEKFGLEVTFPAKWIVGSGDGPLLLMSRSMDQVSLANCVATGEEVAATKGFTQTQLNTGMSKPFGADFWKGVYESGGLSAEIKSEGVRPHASGVTVQEALFDLGKPGAARDSKMTVHQAIFVTPGTTVSVACSARAVAFAKHKITLTAVIDSVRFAKPVASAAEVLAVASGEPDIKRAVGGIQRAGQALLDLEKTP